MQKNAKSLDLFIIIAQYINNNFGKVALQNSMMSVFYTIYGIHKNFPVHKGTNESLIYDFGDDELAYELNIAAKNEPAYFHLYNLYSELSALGNDEFQKSYKESLSFLIGAFCITQLNSRSENFNSVGLSYLMSLFVKHLGCKNVYDPFCGTAFIVHYLKGINFVGQDVDRASTILAKLNMEAQYGNSTGISCANSIVSWNRNHFDAVVSVPPFGLFVSKSVSKELYKELNQEVRTLEDIFFRRAFESNHANCVISFEPLSFCYSKEYYSVRKYLVDNNYIDTIISFPSKILYSTSVPCVMVVCKRNRQRNDSIKFYDVSNRLKEKNNNVNFDPDCAENFFNDIISHKINGDTAFTDDIIKFDYNLYPVLYSLKPVSDERGEKIVRLGDLLKKPRHAHTNDKTVGCIYANRLSRDFMEILKRKDLVLPRVSASEETQVRSYSTKDNKKYLLCSGRTLADAQFAVYSGNKGFTCKAPIQVYEINSELVEDDYLVYQLLNNETPQKIFMPIQNCMDIPIVIDSIQFQRQKMEWEKSNFIQLAKEKIEADRKRLGVKETISDLEHMLGTPQFKINRIIDRLERMKPFSDNYKQTIKSLRDNMNYLNRMIKYHSSNIEAATLNPVEDSISDYISSYTEAWANYGGDYFRLHVENKLPEDVLLKFDKDMMTVLLDSVLENASRHSFHKNSTFTDDNLVLINLTAQVYQGKPYVVIRIANNGDPFKKGFGIKDYISKGRYDATTGRTGLGGYHVYQITKKHNGYMFLDSTRIWNVIIDILLPIDYTEIEDFTEYDHECI